MPRTDKILQPQSKTGNGGLLVGFGRSRKVSQKLPNAQSVEPIRSTRIDGQADAGYVGVRSTNLAVCRQIGIRDLQRVLHEPHAVTSAMPHLALRNTKDTRR
jgi:hypothetical protein